jgi:hypothetical protein
MSLTIGQASTQAGNSLLKLVGVLDGIAGASSTAAAGISRLSLGLDSLTKDIAALSASKNLSDFFFLAFNNSKSLTEELAFSQRELAKLEAGLAQQPSSIYAKSAVAEMREYVNEIKEAKARLDELSGASAADPRARAGIPNRSDGYEREAKRQAALADDLNTFRLKQSGVPASYIKDMTEIIRLNQAGLLVGKEYTQVLAEQQAALLKKTETTAVSVKAQDASLLSYKSLIASIQDKIAADKAELNVGDKLTAAQRERAKFEADILSGALKISKSRQAEARALLDIRASLEASVQSQRDEAKASKDAAAARESYVKSLTSGLEKIQADTAAQIEATTCKPSRCAMCRWTNAPWSC